MREQRIDGLFQQGIRAGERGTVIPPLLGLQHGALLQRQVPGHSCTSARISVSQIGSLEVRMITEPDCKPFIGAVFSVNAPTDGKQPSRNRRKP